MLNLLRGELDKQIAVDQGLGGVLPWVVLPQGDALWEILGRSLCQNRPRPDAKYQPERLETIRELEPDAVFEGKGGMEGYFVAVFTSRQKAICECPFYGNATYILTGDWKALSRKTKAELLQAPQRMRSSCPQPLLGALAKDALGLGTASMAHLPPSQPCLLDRDATRDDAVAAVTADW